MADSNCTESPTHIGDVVSYLNCCSETFGQLSALLSAIEKESPEYSDLRKIASAARYIASDYENMADCWQEEIKRNGVRGHKLTQPSGELNAVIDSGQDQEINHV